MSRAQTREEPLAAFSLDEVRHTRGRDLLIRFAFGAAISATASVVGIVAGERVGGILLAFPAILPATLTLIEEEESVRKARDDDLGSVLGAVALGAFAVVAWFAFPRAGAPASLAAAAAVWLAVAAGLYLLVRAIFGPRSS